MLKYLDNVAIDMWECDLVVINILIAELNGLLNCENVWSSRYILIDVFSISGMSYIQLAHALYHYD